MSKVTEAARGFLSRWQQAAPGSPAGPPASMGAEARSRWRSVTINRTPEEVMPGGRLPGPLAALGDSIEVEIRPAPGSKGTELAARLRTAGPRAVPAGGQDEDPREQVRSALRQAKQLIEVGEVLRVDPQPHGRRPDTPTGRLVESATKHAGGKGLL